MFRISSINGRRKLFFIYFWCFLILSTYELFVDGEEIEGNYVNYPKCLTDEPDVIPKKYPFYLNKKVVITIDVSKRLTHQLTTFIFVIFIKEILGYERIVIHEYEDQFQLTNIIGRLGDVKLNKTFPTSMINLEAWVSSDVDTMEIENSYLVYDNGNSQPPGRFGWFIPFQLSDPIKKYFKPWYDDRRSVHWTLLRDREKIRPFIIDNPVDLELIRQNSVDSSGRYFCSNTTFCQDGIYTPDQCKNGSCALVLSSRFNETKFAIDHVNKFKLYTQIVWVGPNLPDVYNALKDRIAKDGRKLSKSLLILHYTPSYVIQNQTDFITVQFEHCELLNKGAQSNNNDYVYDGDGGGDGDGDGGAGSCKYELNRMVKFSWATLASIDNQLFTALKNFHLNQQDLDNLINIFNKNKQKDWYHSACNWMKTSKHTWHSWKEGFDRTIFIGGIFPITSTSYNGAGIVRGATMARDSINKNKNILPSYNLNLIAFDGKCRADNVLKSFIDYIVDSYYRNLIGVLGPACSDTVEPLAGVAKHFRILAISYSAEGASFSDRQKYPYFFRTIGENSHYKHVYLNLFKRMNWKQVAALTEDGQRYTEYISQMQTLLEENDIKFISNTKFPRERQGSAIMRRYLEDLRMKRARIIILDVYENVARTVMCEAYKLNMTQYDGYIWFLPNWLNETWYNVDYFNKVHNETVNCTTEQVLQAANGYFLMAHSHLASDDTVAIGNVTVREWKKKFYEGTSVTMSRYSGYAYDAIWVYALALDNLSRTDPEALYDLHSPNTTRKLVKLVEDTDFMGVSGRIKFRGGPSRFSVIDLMQFQDNKSNVIGQFHPNLTDDQPVILGGILKLNMASIRWFTRDKRRPNDGTLPPVLCSLESVAQFFNVGCEMAIVILNLLVGTIFILLIVFLFFYWKNNYDRKVQTHTNYLRHLGIDLLNPSNLSDLDKWEIARENVVINRKLGEGAFGTVYGGEANFGDRGWVAVAVKTLKIGSTTEEKLDFLSEAEVMKRFDHKNIVQLLGVCTKLEPIYTIMEFMLYGDLKTFLLARRHLVNQKRSEDVDEISDRKLTSMALDVARGLSYLAKIKYVHRDIASRNCLINAERVVKIGDFGMTRPMFENDYYKFNRKGMLPVRWMAPESLGLGVFTPASDVWSFGILLYEIITFGSFPYQGMSNSQVLDHVKAGNCLQIPKGAKPQLVCLMKACWATEPKDRTPASEIVEFLANNPRILAPCLDAPATSVQLEDTDQLDFELPSADQLRKGSAPNIRPSPSIPNGICLNTTTTTNRHDLIDHHLHRSTTPTTLAENCCPKKPLLGTAKSSSSLSNFGKYIQIHNLSTSDRKRNKNDNVDDDDDDDDDDNDDDDDDNGCLSHNTGNGFAISKV